MIRLVHYRSGLLLAAALLLVGDPAGSQVAVDEVDVNVIEVDIVVRSEAWPGLGGRLRRPRLWDTSRNHELPCDGPTSGYASPSWRASEGDARRANSLGPLLGPTSLDGDERAALSRSQAANSRRGLMP